MFSNANVLLKVSFMDGESKVERQQLRIKRNWSYAYMVWNQPKLSVFCS